MTQQAAGADPIRVPPGHPCHRSACRKPGAEWWNSSTREFYCTGCARAINEGSPGLCVRVELQDVSEVWDGTQSTLDICNSCDKGEAGPLRIMTPADPRGYCAECAADVAALEEVGFRYEGDWEAEVKRLRATERYREAYNRHLAQAAESLAESL